MSQTLPQVASRLYVGSATWSGEKHVVAVGGGDSGLFTLYNTATAFHDDGTQTSQTPRPGTYGFCVNNANGITPGPVCTLANGDLIMLGGTTAGDLAEVTKAYRFVAATQTWVDFDDPEDPDTWGGADHFFIFTLPSGKLLALPGTGFYPVSDAVSWLWDSGWSRIDCPIHDTYNYAQACQLSDGRVLVTGRYIAGDVDGTMDVLAWTVYEDGMGWSPVVELTYTSLPGFPSMGERIFYPDELVLPLPDGAAVIVRSATSTGSPIGNNAFLFDGSTVAVTGAPLVPRINLGGAGGCPGAFLVGGRTSSTGNETTANIERYDANTEIWTLFDTLAYPLADVTCLVQCDRLWCLGGVGYSDLDSLPPPPDGDAFWLVSPEAVDQVVSFETGECSCASAPSLVIPRKKYDFNRGMRFGNYHALPRSIPLKIDEIVHGGPRVWHANSVMLTQHKPIESDPAAIDGTIRFRFQDQRRLRIPESLRHYARHSVNQYGEPLLQTTSSGSL